MSKLLTYLKPYIVPIVINIVLVFLQTIADLSLPAFMSDLVNSGIIPGNIGYIIRTGSLMLLITGGSVICAVIVGFLSSRIAMGFGKNLRADLFSHALGLSLSEFDRVGVPSLITRNTNDITQVQMVVLIIPRMIIAAPIICIGGVIMALSIDRDLAWIIIIIIPILAGFIALIALKGLPLFKAIQAKIDRLNLIVRDGLAGIRVIRSFNRIDDEKKRFHAANNDLAETSVRVNRIMAGITPVIMLLTNLAAVAIIWFGSFRIDEETTNLGSIIAFVQYTMQIITALSMGSFVFIMLTRAHASALRIHEVLGAVPEIRDPDLPVTIADKRSSIEFKDVTFRHQDAGEPAVRNISFKADPGEVIGIIGSTGSGKSTLLKLILRFYDPDSGSIEIGGADIRSMTQEHLRAKMCLIPQDSFLFSGTITHNIGYGKDNVHDDEVVYAAETAQAAEFIDLLPETFNTVIAQGGANISGGQKQRLAIARALIRKPGFYLFDDCFSALDFQTESRLRTALRKETAHAIVFLVSQRVATIMHADRIIVLENGAAAGIGTHRELVKNCRIYQEIVSSQFSEEEPG